MNDFLSSLKGDLLDRRMLPILALVGVGLVAALAYALLAGGGSSTPTPATVSPAVAPTPPSGIAVGQAQTGTGEPVAETTSGTAHRAGGGAPRNPFAPLPGAKTASTATSSTATSESSKSSESKTTESSSSSPGGTPPSSETSQPEPKQKAKVTYRVAVRFGAAAPGTPAPSAPLTPYENLKRQQPLPDSKQPVLVFRGVIAGGKSATFTLVGEAIPHGGAKCLPSASQCQALDLKVGASEELEYAPLGGTPITYELEVVKIEPVKAKAASAASAASAADAFGGASKAGLKILREEGLIEIPGLRYSKDGSVLVFKHAGRAFAARARASAWAAAF
jgi:hypothetical protein